MIDEEMQEQMEEVAEQASTMLMIGVHALDKVLDGLIDKPEIFAKYARLTKVSVDAMVEEGFTREEALAITTQFMSKIAASGSK